MFQSFTAFDHNPNTNHCNSHCNTDYYQRYCSNDCCKVKENNHDLPQNQTDARTNINEDVNDYHDAQHRGED